MEQSTIVYPLITLSSWTFLIGMLMIVMRMRTMRSERIPAEEARHPANLHARYDRFVRSLGDNYVNLHEQPVLFYGICLAIFALGHNDFTHLLLAWSYVTIRMAHSIISVSPARVESRAAVWGLGTAFLGAMLVREVWWMLGF